MALEPQVYMFDEPTAGMSVDEVPVILDLIRELKADATRPSCWSSTRWTWCASSPTASSCCTTAQLVADGEPAAVIASPIVQEAYLGLAPEAEPSRRRHRGLPARAKEAAMNDAAHARRRAHAHRRVSHPARRRPRGAARASSRCCSAATAPARRRRCARSWACGARRKGSVDFDGQRHRAGHAARHARRSRSCGIAYVPENMGIFADLTVKREHAARRARRAQRSTQIDATRLEWIFGAVPGGEEVLEPPGRQAVGRAEADARGLARDRRAARAADRSTSRARASRRPSSTT